MSSLGLEAGTSVDVGPSRRLALAQQKNRVTIHDLKTLSKFADVPFQVQRAEFSPAGSRLVVRTPEGIWMLPLDIGRLKAMMVRGGDDKLRRTEECKYVFVTIRRATERVTAEPQRTEGADS